MAGLALLESKRDRIELKSEAKRLRSAMREVVGVVTTLAQSLELVAKTKNYPTWDAACGACSDGTAGAGPASTQLTHGKPMPGHLMLFCGTTGAGMTCTASAMAASLAEPQPSDLLIVADFREQGHPAGARFVTPSAAFAAGLGAVKERVVLVDGIGCDRSAAFALALANAGHITLATMHATSAAYGPLRFGMLLGRYDQNVATSFVKAASSGGGADASIVDSTIPAAVACRVTSVMCERYYGSGLTHQQ